MTIQQRQDIHGVNIKAEQLNFLCKQFTLTIRILTAINLMAF
jgi:hypothetical protein